MCRCFRRIRLRGKHGTCLPRRLDTARQQEVHIPTALARRRRRVQARNRGGLPCKPPMSVLLAGCLRFSSRWKLPVHARFTLSPFRTGTATTNAAQPLIDLFAFFCTTVGLADHNPKSLEPERQPWTYHIPDYPGDTQAPHTVSSEGSRACDALARCSRPSTNLQTSNQPFASFLQTAASADP